MSAPFILAPGEQHPGAPPPAPRRPFIRVRSHDTGGLLALGEVRLPPLTAGPTLHVHTREDEMFFVLEGVLTMQLGDQLHEIAAGGLAWGARGTPHAFANLASQQLRIMILWIPGGVERLFDEMEAYLQTVAGTPDEEVVAAINARYGAKRVGPQIPVPAP
jgi:mannose-6-phosphate isomerase-like protein (cupin superfamily)